MERLNSVLRRTLEGLGLDAKVAEYAAIEAWASTVAGSLPIATRAADVARGTLFVEVPSAVWAQELSLMKPLLLERINSALPSGRVTEIRFRVGDG